MSAQNAPLSAYVSDRLFNLGFEAIYERARDRFRGQREDRLKTIKWRWIKIQLKLKSSWNVELAPRLVFGADSTIALQLPRTSLAVQLLIGDKPASDRWFWPEKIPDRLAISFALHSAVHLKVADNRLAFKIVDVGIRLLHEADAAARRSLGKRSVAAATASASAADSPVLDAGEFHTLDDPLDDKVSDLVDSWVDSSVSAPRLRSAEVTAAASRSVRVAADANTSSAIRWGDLADKIGKHIKQRISSHLRAVADQAQVLKLKLPVPDPRAIFASDLKVDLGTLDVRQAGGGGYALAVALGVRAGGRPIGGDEPIPLPADIDVGGDSGADIAGLVSEDIPNAVLSKLEGFRVKFSRKQRLWPCLKIGVKGQVELDRLQLDFAVSGRSDIDVAIKLRRLQLRVRDAFFCDKIRFSAGRIETAAEYSFESRGPEAWFVFSDVSKLKAKIKRRRWNLPVGRRRVQRLMNRGLKAARRAINRKLGDSHVKLFELPQQIHLLPREPRPESERLLTAGARTAVRRTPVLVASHEDLSTIGLEFVPGGFTIANRALIAAIRVETGGDE